MSDTEKFCLEYNFKTKKFIISLTGSEIYKDNKEWHVLRRFSSPVEAFNYSKKIETEVQIKELIKASDNQTLK